MLLNSFAALCSGISQVLVPSWWYWEFQHKDDGKVFWNTSRLTGLKMLVPHLEVCWEKSTQCFYIIPQVDKWSQKILVSKSCWIFNSLTWLQIIYQFMTLMWFSFPCWTFRNLGIPGWYVLTELFDQFLSITLTKKSQIKIGW